LSTAPKSGQYKHKHGRTQTDKQYPSGPHTNRILSFRFPLGGEQRVKCKVAKRRTKLLSFKKKKYIKEIKWIKVQDFQTFDKAKDSSMVM